MDKNIDMLKAEARAFRVAEATQGREVTHAQSLEATAKKHGFDNWRSVRARFGPASEERNIGRLPPEKRETPEAKPKQPDDNQKTELEKYVIRRSNDVPLRFSGVTIGSAETSPGLDNEYYFRVSIYRTARGKYIVEKVEDANYMDKIEREAQAIDDANGVVDWLRNEDGELADIAVKALGRAAVVDLGIADAFGEEIE